MAEAAWQPLSGALAPPQHMAGTSSAESPEEWPSSPDRGREFQTDRGIVVRNTFIDVCPLEEESDGDGEGSCASPQQRRNLSAPPSPTRRANEGKRGSIWDNAETGGPYPDSDQEVEEDPGAIPNYQWAGGGLVTAEGMGAPAVLPDGARVACGHGDGWGEPLPSWLQKPPGSPKKVESEASKGRAKGLAEGQQRPALGEFLKGGAAPWGSPPGHGSPFPQGHGGLDARCGAPQPGPHHHLPPHGPPHHSAGAGPHHGLGHSLGFPCGGMGADYARGPGSAHAPPPFDPHLGRRAGYNSIGHAAPYEPDLWQEWTPSPYSQHFGPPTSQAVLSHRAPPSGMIHLPLPGDRLGPHEQGMWPRRDSAGSDLMREPTLALEPPPGTAYISENPPPRDPLGGHIPTEAPAYILGSSGGAATSAPVLASQPLPPQQSVDASRRHKGAGPPGAPGRPLGKPSYGDPKGMPAFQVAHGMNAGGHRYDGGMTSGFSGGCRPMSGDGGGYPGFGSAHGGAALPLSRSAGSGAGSGAVMPSDRQNRFGGSGLGAREGRSLAVGSTAGGGGGGAAQGHSGPWIAPGAMRDMPWLSPAAGAAMEAAGGFGPDPLSGQARAGKGRKGAGREREERPRSKDEELQGAEAKGRVPLSGGGPKRTDYLKKYGGTVENEAGGGSPSVPITTMMLKNIPCRKAQEEVMLHIDQKGFGSRYDFFYLPRDVKFRANLGYAFINFLTPEDAARFSAEMNGYRFTGSGSTKACAVVPAHVQGLMNNLAAFKRTEVMRSSRKPYFSSVVTL